jgi:hypothetical protein
MPQKTDSINSVIVVDSGRGEAFQLGAEEEIGHWKNESGKVHYRKTKPKRAGIA